MYFWGPNSPFTFLPIHAAGCHGAGSWESGNKLSDLVVSSCIPTLSILSPSPKPDAVSSGDLHFLAIRQPPSDGESPLPGVNAELDLIQNSPSELSILDLESSVRTVEEALALMKEVDRVHFACHGIQDDDDLTDSGLCLANEGRLELSDIVALSRSHGVRLSLRLSDGDG